ncbi:MAG: M28 family peptidase [Verrucomicrobiales bacterium]|nr:M28 family peptidase [Verrucomicrobiales bacterium]
MRKLAILPAVVTAAALSIVVCSCDRQSTVPFDESTAVYPRFSGENAFAHVEKQVGFGPRPSGTENLARTREYIVSQLESFGWGVEVMEAALPTPKGEMTFSNIRARFSPSADKSVWDRAVDGILCSHYDSKRFEGFEFLGANDGGSSTGVLIEFARVLAEKPALAERLELVFFDGEEAFGTNITDTDGLYGSRVYSAELALLPEKMRPKWGLLLDMVGDSDLKIRAGVKVQAESVRQLLGGEKEDAALAAATQEQRDDLARQLLAASSDLDVRSKFGISPNFITDDHVPLNNRAGIPTIDIIDFDFDYWHTPGDTMDKISAESLETVGKVTLLLIEKYLLGGEKG